MLKFHQKANNLFCHLNVLLEKGAPLIRYVLDIEVRKICSKITFCLKVRVFTFGEKCLYS